MARASVLILCLGLGLILLVSGGTFAKWTSAISQMTGANIQIGDWIAEEPPVISTESNLPDGRVGVEYRHQFEASNSEKATWHFRGNLPSGLTLSRDGILSGTPRTHNVYTLSITVQNSAGNDEKLFNLTVLPVAPVFAESQILPDAFDGKTYPSTTLTAAGTSKVYRITDGVLPIGMKLSVDGIISGIPRGYGSFTFTVTVSNGGGSDSKEFTINLDSDLPYITTRSLPDATLNLAYSETIAGSGPSPTYSVIDGTLPEGLIINSTTGRITGTPRVHGLSHFTISKSNSLGIATQNLSIYVRYAAPTITSTSLPIVRKNVVYSTKIAGTGDESTFAISEGSLPSGLFLDATTGEISGSTEEIGDFILTITRTNESGVASKSFTLRSMLVVPFISTAYRMPDGFVETYYEVQSIGVGEEIVWSSSKLPDGLSIDTVTGLISGTPVIANSTSFSVTATNSGGSYTISHLIKINAKLPEIITTSIPNGEASQEYSVKLSATGTSIVYTLSGTLPSGMSFDSRTQILSGIPTKAGTFNLTFVAANSGGTVYQALTLIIERDAPTITTESLENAIQNISYAAILAGKGIDSTHAISSGSLPSGISLNATTGRISGTPNSSAHGDYTFTITKTNTAGMASKEFTISVAYQTPTLTGSSAMTQGTLDRAYTYTLTGVGNGVTYTILDGSLPEGMSLNASTGVLSGSPSVTGDFAFTVEKSNESGTVSKEYSLRIVHVKPIMQTKTLDNGTIGVPYYQQLKATGLDLVYSISYGTLPAGLTLDSNTGVISGTPEVAIKSLLRFKATNSGGSSTEEQSYLNILHVPASMITTSLPDATVGTPYSAQIEAVGEALTYSVSNLPAGLKLNTSTGEISGTATTPSTNRSVSFSVSNTGGGVNRVIPMTILTQAPTITTETIMDGILGKTYSQTISGAGSSNTFTITDGELPPGVIIGVTTGSVYGTPTSRGTYTFTITKTNVSGTVSKEFTIKVTYTLPTIAGTTDTVTMSSATVGKSMRLGFGGAGDAVSYSITDGALPPGLNIDEPGIISGIPTLAGNYTFKLRKWNLDGEASKNYVITVLPGATPTLFANESSNGLLLLRSNLE